jgi:DNA-binding transcriptional ArsR family regulator
VLDGKFILARACLRGPRRRDAVVGDSPQSISRLTQGSRLTRQAITKHLRVLEGAGLVGSVRAGRKSLYEFKPKPLDGIKVYLVTYPGKGTRPWAG